MKAEDVAQALEKLIRSSGKRLTCGEANEWQRKIEAAGFSAAVASAAAWPTAKAREAVRGDQGPKPVVEFEVPDCYVIGGDADTFSKATYEDFYVDVFPRDLMEQIDFCDDIRDTIQALERNKHKFLVKVQVFDRVQPSEETLNILRAHGEESE